MASESIDLQPETETVRFRPSKKRKVFRQRLADDNAEDSDIAAVHEPGQPRAVASDFFASDPDRDDTTPAVVKARNIRRSRLRGVGFQAGARSAGVDDNTSEQALVLARQQDGGGGSVAVTGIPDRFTHQTGLLNDINDKHMNEYIESRLRSREAAAAEAAAEAAQRDESQNASGTAQLERMAGAGQPANKPIAFGQPTMRGTLVEVDLGNSGLQGSGARAGGDPGRPSTAHGQGGQVSTKKQRLGPDGKPWRSQKRRGSDDVKRDQLVEQFLHENRLDVYDVASQQPIAADTVDDDVDGDADERLAEQFRRQFEEDMAQRRRAKKKRVAQPASKPKPKNEDVLRGPKLGGSRNSRAAVRDALLKQEKEAKKK